jgi:stress-induced morphogen
MSPFLEALKSKLAEAFDTQAIHITDNSWQHAGHRGNTQNHPDGGTHLAISLVSLKFVGLNPLQRHRLVHQVLAEEMQTRIHALELELKTPPTP